MTAPANWLRLDERSNAMDNLSMCERFLTTLPDPIRWKWVIVALHQALYGYAVAAVQGTNASSVLTDPENHQSNLISIWEALRRTKDRANLWGGTAPLVTTEEEWKAVERVVSEFRNGFEHFRPMSWSIEVSGMPDLVLHVVRVLEGVAIGASSHHAWENGQREVVVATISRLRGHLSECGTT